MARYDPLAPIPPKRLRKMARAYTRAQFGPLLAQINAYYARQAQAGQSSIAQGTQALAAALGGAASQTHGIYAQAQNQQRADDAALAQYLQAAGQSVAASPAGAPAGSYGNLAQFGAGAAAASAGSGSAALSRLVAEGAARENYASNLPNIGRLGGLQRARDLQLQLESGRQKEVAGLQAKIPGVVSQIEQDLANREFQKAAAELSFTGGIQKAQISAATSAANTKARVAATERGQNLTHADRVVSNDISRWRATHPSRAGHSKAAPGLTPGQEQKTRSNAIEAAKALKHGQPNPNYDPNSTNYHNGIPDNQRWKQKGGMKPLAVYQYLRRHGVNPVIADWAVGQVYGKWKSKGQGKRLK